MNHLIMAIGYHNKYYLRLTKRLQLEKLKLAVLAWAASEIDLSLDKRFQVIQQGISLILYPKSKF